MVMQERPSRQPAERPTGVRPSELYLDPKENVSSSFPKLFLADEGNLGPANRLDCHELVGERIQPVGCRVAVKPCLAIVFWERFSPRRW